MPTVLVVLGAGLLIAALAFRIAYSLWLLRLVRWHFGEESRRDVEPRRRRKEFEGRCTACAAAIYVSVIAGVSRGALSVLLPEVAGWALLVQVIACVVAGLFAWSALAHWREPFENRGDG